MRNLTPDNIFVSPDEKSVFEQLSASLGNEWAGAHNFKIFRVDSTPGLLCQHCEIDLLLCHPDYGIFVGEIKGGKGDGAARQLGRSVAALKTILKKRFPLSARGDFLHEFVCFPNQKKEKNSAAGKAVPAMFADDLDSGVELFLLRLLLRKNVGSAGTTMASLLAKSPQGLFLPAKRISTRMRERLRNFFLHLAWLLRDPEAAVIAPEISSPRVPAGKSVPPSTIADLVREKESSERIAQLRALLAGGESANSCDQSRQSLLSIAIKNGNKIFSEMIFRTGGRVMPANGKRISKAFSLFGDGLLAEMISQNALSESADNLSDMARMAYLRGFVLSFRALIRKYPREVLLSVRVNTGTAGTGSLVHSAAFLKTSDFLRALAENGFPLDSADAMGRTPLQIAQEYNREENIRFLANALTLPDPSRKAETNPENF